jgi:hypothetical protein
VRQDPTVLIADPERDFRTFRVAATSPLGSKRGAGRGGFIDSVLAAVDGFYATVVQHLRPWSAKAPQLPRITRTAVEEAGIDIEPPPLDLKESDDSDLESRPPDGNIPSEVVAAVDDVNLSPIEMTEPADSHDGRADVAPATELVSWEVAHERLEHERTTGTDSDTSLHHNMANART